MWQKIKDLWISMSKNGMMLPFLLDPTTNKPSITLMFAYMTFTLAICSTIGLHWNVNFLTASITSILFWMVATIFYMIRKLNKAKLDLDDKSIELENDSTEKES